MFSWMKRQKKNKFKLRPLSEKEKKEILEKALAKTSKFMKDTRGMSMDEIQEYRKENGYKEISEEDNKRYREMFQKAFEKAMKEDVKKDNSLKALFKRAFLQSKYN